jgi:drug/metabolite transporter (DMT)-like permease
MSRPSWIKFMALAAFWGASYMFIKLGLEDLSPAMVVFLRTALAALVLLPVALRMEAFAGLRERLGALAVLALVQVAGPFMLISVGEQEIASSLAGILVASAPIFTAILAVWVDHEERSHGLALAGVVAGMAGVMLLLGVDTGGGTAAIVGGVLVLVASLGYAIGALWLKRRLTGPKPIGLVTATMALSALMTLPAAALSAPDSLPGLEAVAAVSALGVIGTGISFVIFYDLIATIGPAKTTLVAYVAPGFSVVYGVTLLDESFTVATAVGLFLILGGSWVAAEGRLPWRRRPRVPITGELPGVDDVQIRPAAQADVVALHRLAGLDSKAWTGGAALVAEVGGELWAALSLDGGPVIADPFRRTTDLLALLELRREQLARRVAQPRRRAGRRLLRSPARA